jgi:hypothetical protein
VGVKVSRVVALALIWYSGCNAESAKQLDLTEELVYKGQYELWRKSIDSELATGRSWVSGENEICRRLSAHAPLHISYLLEILRHDMFCVLVLEGNPDLVAELRKLEGELTGGLQTRQEAWMAFLDRKRRGH